MRWFIKITYILVALGALSCAVKLPQSELKLPSEYIHEEGFNTCHTPVSNRWWEAFDDPRLDELIDAALIHNRDLLATATTVSAAQHYIKVARAEFLPSLSLDMSGEALHEEGSTTQEYSIAPTIKWEVSLFNALRQTKKSAVAAFMAKEWNWRGAILSLTSQVATSYFTLLQYERSLYIATRSYELRRTATALVDSMYRYGMSSGTDLMQAKSLVYAAKIEMQKYQRAVATTSLSLDVLLGNTPRLSQPNSCGTALIYDNIPISIPVGLPSSLLERRPDVLKSYYTMVEAAAEVGISRAGRYPILSLTGNGGVFASSISGLTSDDPLLWSVSAVVAAPIFQFGALKRKELIEREEYMASVANYEETILEALAEVEKSLCSISTYSNQSASMAALVLANTKIVQNTSALYKSGLGDYLSVIDAERELYSSQIELIEVVAQQYINYVDLFKALGGGWLSSDVAN